jgi:hypothetical protein
MDMKAVTEQINLTRYRISLAHTYAPSDIFTKVARLLVFGITVATMVLAPIEIITTGIGGCLIGFTLGLGYLVLSVIWWPFGALLLGTSWLWFRAWYLRPLLLLPGVIVDLLATIYVMLMPDPEKDSKYAKLSLVAEWPLSWYLLRPPAE